MVSKRFPILRSGAALAGIASAIVLLVGLTLGFAGCSSQSSIGGAPRPLAVAFIVDPTHSAQKSREARYKELKSVWDLCLPDEAMVAIIRIDHDSETMGEGEKERLSKTFQGAWKPRPCRDVPGEQPLFCGSDPVTALRLAVKFLNRPEHEGCRKLIIGWTDLVADPCFRNGRGNPIAFRDPKSYDWEGLKDSPIEVVLFGVPEREQDKYEQAWRGRFKTAVKLFGPNHIVNPEQDLGLTPQASL
jgi:hypothetical protein